MNYSARIKNQEPREAIQLNDRRGSQRAVASPGTALEEVSQPLLRADQMLPSVPSGGPSVGVALRSQIYKRIATSIPAIGASQYSQ